MSVPEVKKRGTFLEYAGVRVPDRQARDLVAGAVRQADIVGVPKQRLPNFLPLLVPVLQAHGLDFRTMPLTLSTINYELESGGHWGNISGRRAHAGRRQQSRTAVGGAGETRHRHGGTDRGSPRHP